MRTPEFGTNASPNSDAEVSVEDTLITSKDFPGFFREIHGTDPFPWQQRLTSEVLENKAWPKVIALPTGTGKTAVLDIAIFSIAAQPYTFPRRVVFVIDRRIVVDQVCERAHRILKRLETASPSDKSILGRVRNRLESISGNQLLGVTALRGGIPIDGAWARRPEQPWVIVSTVDQFGSRLLFRGYGVSQNMRPVHAGLAGNDCLVILDEVHLSVPFAQTLTHIEKLKSKELPRRFQVVEMSATPRNKTTNHPEPPEWYLDQKTDIDECEELRRRVMSKKQAELKLVNKPDEIPGAVIRILKSINKSKDTQSICSVGVIVNLVNTARKTYTSLVENGYRAHLITGRMRPLDRIEILDEIHPIVDPEKSHQNEQLVVIVSTQAIEVGADFSFDALVTECAAIDSLCQRFGRLDRRGQYWEKTGCPAKAWVIGLRPVVVRSKPDPIYRQSTKAAWEELERRADGELVNIDSMSLRNFPSNALAPSDNAPLLLKTHMDAWSQTKPEPIVQPTVDWFLHGITDEDSHTEVSVLWRRDRTIEALRLVPPRQTEYLQIPLGAIKAWLSGSKDIDVADVAQRSGGFPAPDSEMGASEWVRWNGFGGNVDTNINVEDICPGDILIVDPARGGLNAGTWDPSSKEPVCDLGDQAQFQSEHPMTLRLDPKLPYISKTPPTPPADENAADRPANDRIRDWLAQQVETGDLPDWMQKTIEHLLSGNFIPKSVIEHNSDGAASDYYVLTEGGRPNKKTVDPSIMDGSDRAGSYIGTGISLSKHLQGVGECAQKIAIRLDLPQKIVDDLLLAGQLHDIGKVDARFQSQLVGDDPIELERYKRDPLAKSLPGTYTRLREYPKDMRHEIASVAMVLSNHQILDRAHDKELVLHLIGAHHGWGRPLLPIIEDPKPQTLTYELDGLKMETNSDLSESSLALHMSNHFWSLLERYGYYGLAWLESILRLADHQQSAEEGEAK